MRVAAHLGDGHAGLGHPGAEDGLDLGAVTPEPAVSPLGHRVHRISASLETEVCRVSDSAMTREVSSPPGGALRGRSRSPVLGLFDEIGHLATAWVLLLAPLPTAGDPRPWALLGAVLMDVDHIPLYVWGVESPTPSLAVVLVSLALSRLGGRLRRPFTGLALGVVLHLVRDVVTVPGAPLLWLITGTSALAP